MSEDFQRREDAAIEAHFVDEAFEERYAQSRALADPERDGLDVGPGILIEDLVHDPVQIVTHRAAVESHDDVVPDIFLGQTEVALAVGVGIG